MRPTTRGSIFRRREEAEAAIPRSSSFREKCPPIRPASNNPRRLHHRSVQADSPIMPDRYAVIGNPVAHSKSPLIHAAFARATGQAMSYERLLAPLDGFAAAAKRFASE